MTSSESINAYTPSSLVTQHEIDPLSLKNLQDRPSDIVRDAFDAVRRLLPPIGSPKLVWCAYVSHSTPPATLARHSQLICSRGARRTQSIDDSPEGALGVRTCFVIERNLSLVAVVDY